MAARATGSATISFGLVSIPIKVYTAVSKENVAFHMLHKTCGTRVKLQYYCPLDKEVIQRRDTVKGYEHAKDQFVRFEDDELKKLEAERTDQLDIVEFVPAGTVDAPFVGDVSYLGPGKGGDRAYKLLADSMARLGRHAIGRFFSHNKTVLVMLSPYKGGLMMHKIHYADEVRSMEDIELPAKVAMKQVEQDLADKLIAELSAERFDPSRFRDEFKERVLTAVEQKVAGKELSQPPEQRDAQIIDLFEALQRSLAERRDRREPAAANEVVAEAVGSDVRPEAEEAKPAIDVLRDSAFAGRSVAKAAPKPRAPRVKKQA